jgi:peroxiredoxin
MKARYVVSLAALFALLTAAGCGGGSGTPNPYGLTDWPDQASTGPEIGERAPNFKLETADGQTVELASFAGRPVLVNFFASWCANCREEMRALETAYRGGVAVVGVDYRESAETVQSLAAETGVTFPLALDRDVEVTRQGFKVVNLPATVLIDEAGIIREIVRGPVDEAGLRELLLKAGVGSEATT